MDHTIKQAMHIIDAVQTLLGQAQRFNDEQTQHLWTIYHYAEDFINVYMQRRHQPPAAFANYLSHDAMSPVTIMIGYAELLRSGICGVIPSDCDAALTEISTTGRTLQHDIKILYTSIQQQL